MIIVLEMEWITWDKTLDDVVCISFCTNALWKGMDLFVLTPSIGDILEETGFFIFGMAPVLKKEISEFKPAVLSSTIDLVSYPAYGGWV